VSDLIANLQSSLRWIDVLDVAIVAFILYRVLLLIKGTRAMQMVTGLGILGIGFFLSVFRERFRRGRTGNGG
jgi:diadenylate cyclase